MNHTRKVTDYRIERPRTKHHHTRVVRVHQVLPKSTNDTSACQHSRRMRFGTMTSTTRSNTTKEGTLESTILIFAHTCISMHTSSVPPHRIEHTLTHRHHKETAGIINRSDQHITTYDHHVITTLESFVCFCFFVCLPFLFASVQRRSDVAPTSRAEVATPGLGGRPYVTRTWYT